MKILCPTDFSPRSHIAAQVALGLARETAGTVEVLHVVSPRTDPGAVAIDVALLEDRIRNSALASLEAERRALSSEAVSVTSWLAEGDIETSIQTRAWTIGADLIVMASHSKPAPVRFILGSVAERTVRQADRPVLIVPPGTEPRPAGPGAGGPLNVVVALDGRPGSQGALDFARSLRRRVRCDLTFLRLYWPVEEYDRLGLTDVHNFAQAHPAIAADLTRSLEREIGELPGTGTTSIVVEPAWGEPASAILAYARARRCDFVIMGAESRHGLARIAHAPIAARVARHVLGVPVVFVPPPAAQLGSTETPAITTVLAPTDLSMAGNRAVAFAYALLAPRGGVVELCYVHEHSPPMPPSPYGRAEGTLSDTDRASFLAQLRALVPADAERAGITTHVTVIDGGKAAQAILQVAERFTVDAIVLGAHGRGAAYRALVGSVSAEVVRLSHRPVLVVPRPKETS